MGVRCDPELGVALSFEQASPGGTIELQVQIKAVDKLDGILAASIDTAFHQSMATEGVRWDAQLLADGIPEIRLGVIQR